MSWNVIRMKDHESSSKRVMHLLREIKSAMDELESEVEGAEYGERSYGERGDMYGERDRYEDRDMYGERRGMRSYSRYDRR